MIMIIRQQLIIYIIKIAIGLCLNLDSINFKLYQYNNTRSLKFSLTFENTYLLATYSNVNIIKCISVNSKNSLTKAISYEVNPQDSTTTCKSYSQLNFQTSDIRLTESTKSWIYLRNDAISKTLTLNCK